VRICLGYKRRQLSQYSRQVSRARLVLYFFTRVSRRNNVETRASEPSGYLGRRREQACCPTRCSEDQCGERKMQWRLV
jgi:hypothetical protein